LTLNVRLLAKQVPNAEMNRTVTQTLELADKITNEIRGLSYLLHPPMLDELGLGPALREYVDGVSERTGLRIQLTIQEALPHLEDELAITIFRIIQECLTNVHRHSDSPEATIELTHNGKEIQLRVADAGPSVNRGTDKPIDSTKKKLGVGIAGMKERVKHLRGTLEFLSSGNGTTVIARLPIPKAHD
jgi:two-component system NarL family sensor kinase